MKLVNEVYAGDIARATPEQRLEIARKMLQTGLDTADDAAGRFALLGKAADIAAQVGDIGVACEALDDLDRFYRIDTLQMKAATATAVSNAARNPDQRVALAAELSNLVDRALADERYDIARALAQIALSSARAANDADQQRGANARLRLVRDAETAYAGIKTAVAVLADKPDDPDANLRVGRFRCFFKGDWAGGLPMLAKGSDTVLQALAARELLGAVEPDAQVALGDSWWTASEKEDSLAKNQFQKRAGKWYGDAAPHVTGFAKAKIEVRLKAIAAIEAVATPITVRAFYFVQEFGDRLFDAAAAAGAKVPDELTISSNGSALQIMGKKKSDTATILGHLSGHFGKVGTLSMGLPAGGTMGVGVSASADHSHARYYAMLLDKEGKPKTAELPLQTGQHYKWRLEQAGDEVKLQILQDDKQVSEITAPAKDFRGVGFGATVRWRGDAANMTITYR